MKELGRGLRVPEETGGFLRSFLHDESVVRLGRDTKIPSLNSKNSALRLPILLWGTAHSCSLFIALYTCILWAPHRVIPHSFHSEPYKADIYGLSQLGFLASGFCWVWLMGGTGTQSKGSRKVRWIFLFTTALPARLQVIKLYSSRKGQSSCWGPFLHYRSHWDPATTPSPCYSGPGSGTVPLLLSRDCLPSFVEIP